MKYNLEKCVRIWRNNSALNVTKKFFVFKGKKIAYVLYVKDNDLI